MTVNSIPGELPSVFSHEAGVRRDAECRSSDAAGRRSATAEGRSRAGFLRYGTIFLAMLFFLCCVCVMPAAAVDVGTYEDLKNNLSDGTVRLITITDDIPIGSGDSLPVITREVTITSNSNKKIYRTGANTTTTSVTGMFIIGAGGQLILSGSVVLDGNNTDQTIAGSNRQSLVYVKKGGIFNLTGYAVLKNNTADYGGGVSVAGGTFNMTGGNIKNNTAGSSGGGVYIKSGSTFTMSGGSIEHNTATGNIPTYRSGGGVYVAGGTFEMSGSAIVNEDNRVYLQDDRVIKIEGSLNDNGGAKNISSNALTLGRTIVEGGESYLDQFGLSSTLTSSKYKLVPSANNLVLSANITLTLNKNGGIGGTDAVEVTWKTHDFNITSIENPTKTGYTFGGWYSQSGAGVLVINTSGLLEKNVGGYTDANGKWTKEDLKTTLYANWTAITYNVSYNGNGATSGSMQESTHTYDVAKELTANAFTRTGGYTFAGWATSAGGPVVYTDSQSVLNLSSTAGATVPLYANWTTTPTPPVTTYTVTVQSDGHGTCTASCGTTATPGDTVTLTASPNPGYHFKQWRIVLGGVSITGNTFTMPQANVKVIGQFEADGGSSGGNMDNAYRVLFEIFGGSFISPVTGLSAGDVIPEPPAPTKKGYTFGGWYTDESCTKKWNFADGIPGDMTLYAKWIGGTPTPTPAATTGQPTAQQTTTPSVPVTGEPTGDTTISPTDDTVSPSGDATGGVPPTGTGTGDDGSSGNSIFSLPLLLLLLLVLGLVAYYLYRRYT